MIPFGPNVSISHIDMSSIKQIGQSVLCYAISISFPKTPPRSKARVFPKIKKLKSSELHELLRNLTVQCLKSKDGTRMVSYGEEIGK